ncbi:MAG: RluA family pseudouridine synthase [Firmicutes bacterium]|nr:RluA family pseudouridine synthase [Bacillota bacterium]
MKKIIVEKGQGNKKLITFLRQNFKDMPVSAIYKAIRKKDIKVNGKRVKGDHILLPGDLLEIYIPDNILKGIPLDNGKANSGLSLTYSFTVVYEDNNIIIVNKEQGIPVHPDRNQKENTLIDSVKYYLQQKGEYNPLDSSSFSPSLCHRLDRNTGGLVIIAKNPSSLKIILDKIKANEIKKYYQCLVKGKMDKEKGELRAFLEKDESKSRVFISNEKKPGSLEIITKYKVLSYKDDISKLEIELVTGRTHQIRAHLAYIGHPILGDGKYGINSYNRAMKLKKQALWAYKVIFDLKKDNHFLQYLKGKSFEVEPQWEVRGWK